MSENQSVDLKVSSSIYLTQSHTFSVDMSKCILTFSSDQGHLKVIVTVYFHVYHHEFSTTTDSHNNILTTFDRNSIHVGQKSSIWDFFLDIDIGPT